MATQWPNVVTRLVALLPTLPSWGGVQVFRGAAYDVTAATFCTVAHATDGTLTAAGSYTTTQAADGYRYVEQGSVACQLVCTDDGPDLDELDALMFGLVDELDQAIRADRTLAVLSQDGFFDMSVNVQTAQAIPGAVAALAFTPTYYTVT